MSAGSLSELRRVNQRYRALLGAREVGAMRQIAAAYNVVWDSLDRRVTDLAENIGRFDNPGEVPARLFRMEQYRSLQTDLAAHMGEMGDYVDAVVTDEQRFGIQQGRERALHQIEAVYGDLGREMASLNRLPNSALADMVGNTRDGSPLRSLLDGLGPDASRRVERGLIEGIALTLNPREVARHVRDGFGGNMSRALTVSRTELLRATRESAHRHFQENSHAVAGWIWLASLDDRCCLACVYMHGTTFSLEESFDSHPNCRCTNSPFPPNSRVIDMIESGEDWFERQPEDIKLRMMGPGKYRAYQEGMIDLSRLVHVSHDDRWGTTRREASLISLLSTEQYRAVRGLAPVPDVPQFKDASLFRTIEQNKVGKMRHKLKQLKDQIGPENMERYGPAVKWYKGSGYEGMNSTLRGRPEGSYKIRNRKRTEEAMRDMDEMFRTGVAPQVGENMVVFRGAASQEIMEPFHRGESMVGRVVGDKGYLSTSMKESVAVGFTWDADVPMEHLAVMEIRVPETARAIPGDSFRARGEQELIFDRGSQFRVVEIRDNDIIRLAGDERGLARVVLEMIV